MKEFDFKSLVNYRNDDPGSVSGEKRTPSQREIGEQIVGSGIYHPEKGSKVIVVSREGTRSIPAEGEQPVSPDSQGS